jgi:hypothetical protein
LHLCVFIVVMPIAELTAMARRFHRLARITSDPVMKERLVTLGNDYLEQVDQLKCERRPSAGKIENEANN